MLNTEPLCIIIIFLLLNWIETEKYKNFKKTDYVLFGMAFGLLLWMKYPMIIVMFPFWLYVCHYSVKTKNLLIFIKRCFISFITVLTISLPVMGYFGYYGIIDLMIKSYFLSVHKQEWMLMGSFLEIAIGLIFILSVIGIIMIFKKDRLKIYFTILFMLIFFICNAGGIRPYTASIIIVLIPMWVPILWKNKYLRPVATGIIVFIILMFAPQNNNAYKGLSTKEVAEKHGITNNNILYLCEDLGLGNYSPDKYKEKYQWTPDRISYNENKEVYEKIMKWIKEETFQYVCVRANDFDCVVTEDNVKENRYANIIKYTQDNYVIVEEFVFNDTMKTKYYVLVTKQ